MRISISILLIAGLATPSAHAASFSEQCPDIATCANAVSRLLGQKYIFDNDVRGMIKATSNVELTQENAEILFTDALNMSGFSRVPLAAPGTYQIMRQRDARDSAIPTVSADAHTKPKLPDTWDLYTMKYKATNAEVVEHLARFAHSFMPATSRIIPVEFSGILLVTDTAPNLKKMYDLIKDNDVKPTVVMRKKWEEQDKLSEKRHLLELTQPRDQSKGPPMAGGPVPPSAHGP